jgi:hypothetical protein
MLVLNAALSPSLVAELLDRMYSCVSEVRAASKRLIECMVTFNQMIEWYNAHGFPSFVTQEDIVDI